MAINPTQFATPRSFVGDIDWSPLQKIGETIKQKMDEDEAARLLAQLYGQGQPNAAPAGQPQAAGAPQPPPVPTPPQVPPALAGPVPLPRPRPQEASGIPGPTNVPGAPAPPPWYDQAAAQTYANFPLKSGVAPVPTTGVAPWPVQDPQTAAPASPKASDAMAFAPETEAPKYSQAGLDRALSVVKNKMESGGDYANVTTTTNPRTGQRQSALGAYGIMDFNVPQWTKEVLGRAMSPQEFLNNQAAQDAVARAKFGQYADKYGLTGAARAWLGGEGNMYGKAADAFGTTPDAYAAKFERNMGLPPEITTGASRPTAVQPSQQALAFDATKSDAVDHLVSGDPKAPTIGPEQVAALAKNPLTRPLAIGLVQKQLDPGTYDFKIVGDNLVRTNSRTGRTEIVMHDIKDDYEVKTVKDGDGNERLVRVKKQGAEGPIDTGDTQQQGGNFGKLPTDHRWRDPNDKRQGVEPIPGSNADKIGDEIVARVGLAKSFMGTLPDLRARVARGDVGIENVANHAQAMANVGVPGETKRMLDAGAESLIRLLTGAGMSATEAEQNAMQYRITPRDTTFTINSKINALERHLNAIGEVMGRSRGGGNLLAAPAPAAPDGKLPPADAPRYLETKKIGGKNFGRVGNGPNDWVEID